MSSTGKRWFREMHVKGAREIVEAGEKLKSIKPHPVCSLYGGSRQPWSSGRSSRPRGGRMAGSSEPKEGTTSCIQYTTLDEEFRTPR
jgi:hypothetical protein